MRYRFGENRLQQIGYDKIFTLFRKCEGVLENGDFPMTEEEKIYRAKSTFRHSSIGLHEKPNLMLTIPVPSAKWQFETHLLDTVRGGGGSFLIA